jgi:hypothetical protein
LATLLYRRPEDLAISVKGRGVVAKQHFKKWDYLEELVRKDVALEREKNYSENPGIGSFLYFFQHGGKELCILEGHSFKNPNTVDKAVFYNNQPMIVCNANKDISPGEGTAAWFWGQKPSTHPRQCCQLAEISAAKHKSGPKKISAAGQISGRIFYKISKKWQKRGRTFSEVCS